MEAIFNNRYADWDTSKRHILLSLPKSTSSYRLKRPEPIEPRISFEELLIQQTVNGNKHAQISTKRDVMQLEMVVMKIQSVVTLAVTQFFFRSLIANICAIRENLKSEP